MGDDFSGSVLHDGDVIRASLTGDADHVARPELDALLARVHADATRLGAAKVVVDVRQLAFMSSSCFKSLVSWVTGIQELAEAQRYRVTFLSNPQLHWQKRSLHSLHRFAAELVTVEES